MGRQPKLMAGVGRKNSGKSFTTEKMLQEYARGNPQKGIPPRRVLILDVNDEYSQFKAIRLKDVQLFSIHNVVEIRRIRPFREDGKRMTLDQIAETLFEVLQTFANGLLLIEDVNKYISDSMPNDLIGAICTNRHIGVDIILHYQSIGRITSKVWQNVNIIRLHKFTDTVEKHRKKFEDKYEYLSLAEIMIDQKIESGDKYFFLYIDVDIEKIYGAFTERDFDQAITSFMQKDYKSLINPMLNARDLKGMKIHTPETAMMAVKKRLLQYKM